MPMPALPLVSVILPVYNHQSFVGEALDSIFDQTYPHLQVIVVDDGSDDRSPEIVEEHLAHSPYPAHFIQQSNQGAHAAINTGIEASGGQYLAILNSDDRYHADRISSMVERMEERSARFAFSRVQHINQEGNPLTAGHPHLFYYRESLQDAAKFPSPSFEILRHNMVISTGNFLFTRNLFHEVGPFRPYVTCHDWDYVLRVILVEEPMFVDQDLYHYRIHPDNTLRKRDEVRGEEINEVVAAYLERMDEAQNTFAPSPRTWRAYWRYFVPRYLQHFQDYDRIQKALSLNEEDLFPPANDPLEWVLELTFLSINRLLSLRDCALQSGPQSARHRRVKWFRCWARTLAHFLPDRA